jgi:hypothetical protein
MPLAPGAIGRELLDGFWRLSPVEPGFVVNIAYSEQWLWKRLTCQMTYFDVLLPISAFLGNYRNASLATRIEGPLKQLEQNRAAREYE